jgi:hypothetical protein
MVSGIASVRFDKSMISNCNQVSISFTARAKTACGLASRYAVAIMVMSVRNQHSTKTKKGMKYRMNIIILLDELSSGIELRKGIGCNNVYAFGCGRDIQTKDEQQLTPFTSEIVFLFQYFKLRENMLFQSNVMTRSLRGCCYSLLRLTCKGVNKSCIRVKVDEKLWLDNTALHYL